MRAFPSSSRFPANVLFAEGCWPGVARRPVTFFCFAKRKSPKKRRPAVRVPALRFGQPAVLEPSGVSLELATLRFAQTIAIPDPLASALLGPARTGQLGAGAGTNTNKDTPWRVLVSSGIRYWYSAVGISSPRSHPLWMRRGAQGQTDQGWRCLSEAQRSEFSQTLAGPSTAGCPQRSGGTQQPGSPFLLLTFLLAKQKKSELPPGNPRPTALGNERPARARTGKGGEGIPA